MASAHHAGHGEGRCAEYARHGVDFLIDKMWDEKHGGFFWITDRAGNVTCDKKILYGLSFIMYAFSEYTMATEDARGVEYAEKTFDLLKKHATDTMYGGYFEMFERNWDLCGPGPQGGDRKTLDVHMHLMEAFTTLYECTGQSIHKRTLIEDIDLLIKRILHPEYATGIPQFTPDWKVAPQLGPLYRGWAKGQRRGQHICRTQRRVRLVAHTCNRHYGQLFRPVQRHHQEGDGSRAGQRRRSRIRRRLRRRPALRRCLRYGKGVLAAGGSHDWNAGGVPAFWA
jgi:hypothetical protein